MRPVASKTMYASLWPSECGAELTGIKMRRSVHSIQMVNTRCTFRSVLSQGSKPNCVTQGNKDLSAMGGLTSYFARVKIWSKFASADSTKNCFFHLKNSISWYHARRTPLLHCLRADIQDSGQRRLAACYSDRFLDWILFHCTPLVALQPKVTTKQHRITTIFCNANYNLSL